MKAELRFWVNLVVFTAIWALAGALLYPVVGFLCYGPDHPPEGGPEKFKVLITGYLALGFCVWLISLFVHYRRKPRDVDLR